MKSIAIIRYISLMLCLFGIITVIQTCPTGCKCRFTQVSCEDLHLKTENLTTIAEEISNKTEILYLSRNQIDDFPIHLFAKLSNLRALHLRSNLLTRIPNNAGLYLPNLRELDLEENKINMITSADFTGYSDVRTLYLQVNKIESLPERTFQKLIELRYLYLESNFIKQIRKNSFAGLHKLLYLSLAQNDIETIEEKSFDDCKDIEQIFFNSNKLKMVPNALFVMSRHINQIDFSTNEILNISEHAFSNMSNIVMVDIVLNSNAIRFIPSSSFKLSRRLTIGLTGNVIHCDCQLLSNFHQLVDNDRDIIVTGAYCASPISIQNQDVSYVNMSALSCDLCQAYICRNNGTCVTKTSVVNTRYSYAECLCTDRFEGQFCGHIKPFIPTTISLLTPCKNHGCRNKAECIVVSKSKYKCNCRSRYTGKLCETYNSDDGKESSTTLSTWIAIGVSILVLIIAICLTVCLCRRKRKQKKCMVEENRILEEKLQEENSDLSEFGTTL